MTRRAAAAVRGQSHSVILSAYIREVKVGKWGKSGTFKELVLDLTQYGVPVEDLQTSDSDILAAYISRYMDVRIAKIGTKLLTKLNYTNFRRFQQKVFRESVY